MNPMSPLQPPDPAGIPLPVPTAGVPEAPISAVGQGTTPDVADDLELIEPIWVQKTKDIIRETQHDPYQQSRELNLFKADYMRKRYNKVLKLGD